MPAESVTTLITLLLLCNNKDLTTYAPTIYKHHSFNALRTFKINNMKTIILFSLCYWLFNQLHKTLSPTLVLKPPMEAFAESCLPVTSMRPHKTGQPQPWGPPTFTPQQSLPLVSTISPTALMMVQLESKDHSFHEQET